MNSQGLPLALYRDRHSIFETSHKEPLSLREQLSGRRDPTQFGRLLEELSIASIPARSPQAKGRIERLWGSFQDRLVSEMRLKGVSNLEEANRFLGYFLPRYNRRFAVPPAEEGSAWRPLPEGFDLDRAFCFKHRREVGADNVVSFEGHRLQILADPHRSSYVRAEVEVCEDLEGDVAVYYEGRRLRVREAPLEAPALRALPQPPSRPKGASTEPAGPGAGRGPGPDHPWRKPFPLSSRQVRPHPCPQLPHEGA